MTGLFWLKAFIEQVNAYFLCDFGCFVHSGTLALGMDSAFGLYGLMSIIGDPSKASSPFTVNVQFLTSESFTTHRPMGFGREGLRQAKTPVSIFTACFLGKTSRVFLFSLLSLR
jgi:hypothetical protein